MIRTVILLLPTVVIAGEADPLREVLRETRPPWYDDAADGWRRIEVREPTPPPTSSDNSAMPGLQLVAVLLLIGLIAAVVWVLWQLRRLRVSTLPESLGPAPAMPARGAPDLSLLPLPDAGLPPEEGLRRALAAGDWRRAVVWVHARLLTRLDAAGALRLERGATERQLLSAARAWAANQPARRRAAEALARTGAAFAAVYFGHATADRALVDGLLAADADAERTLTAEGA